MMKSLKPVSRLLTILFLSAAAIPAAEIALSGADPTEFLTTNPPVFAFTVDSGGFFTGEYVNASGFTFLNLLVTGPATGITSVGCSPGFVFTACSASIDIARNLVNFTFSGGPGILNNDIFFLTARNFVPGQTLAGTSTSVVGSPEPRTLLLMAIALIALFIKLRRTGNSRVLIASRQP